MVIFYFIVFFVLSWFGLMQIFRLTTYHKYFFPALPLLLAYSALVGFLLFRLGLHGGFIWQLGLSIALFVDGASKNRKSVDAMMTMTDDAEDLRLTARSGRDTARYYALSACVYLATFAFTYLYFLNAHRAA